MCSSFGQISASHNEVQKRTVKLEKMNKKKKKTQGVDVRFQNILVGGVSTCKGRICGGKEISSGQ